MMAVFTIICICSVVGDIAQPQMATSAMSLKTLTSSPWPINYIFRCDRDGFKEVYNAWCSCVARAVEPTWWWKACSRFPEKQMLRGVPCYRSRPTTGQPHCLAHVLIRVTQAFNQPTVFVLVFLLFLYIWLLGLKFHFDDSRFQPTNSVCARFPAPPVHLTIMKI